MTKAYKEIMERVRLTEEMEQRVLMGALAAMEPSASSRACGFRRWGALAACLVVMAAGALLLPGLWSQPVEPGPVTVTPQMVSAATQQQLEELVGFPVETLTGLPFTPIQVEYTAYGEMAQVRYVGEEQTAVYRKAVSEEDISGDYTLYDHIWQVERDGVTLTLKGNEEGCALVLWKQGDFSCSLRFTPPVEETLAVDGAMGKE